jgi:hypothetical protein
VKETSTMSQDLQSIPKDDEICRANLEVPGLDCVVSKTASQSESDETEQPRHRYMKSLDVSEDTKTILRSFLNPLAVVSVKAQSVILQGNKPIHLPI